MMMLRILSVTYYPPLIRLTFPMKCSLQKENEKINPLLQKSQVSPPIITIAYKASFAP